MAGKKSKDKGRRHENHCCKVLGEWWWGKRFRRTPLSGGWDKVAHDQERIAFGDIHTPPDFPWSVECKHDESWTFEGLLCDKCVKFEHWWKQCYDDAEAANKQPLLIFTKNYVPDFAAVGLSWVCDMFRGVIPFSTCLILRQVKPSAVALPLNDLLNVLSFLKPHE